MRKISQETEMTLVTLTLTLGPQGHLGMLTLFIPTYYVNLMKIRGHLGCQMPISRFDLERYVQYLTLRAKIQNSASCNFFVLSQRTFLYVFIALL